MGDLTTLAAVKGYLQIGTGDTTSDALLSRMITAASSFIESILNRTFAAADYTQRQNGTGAQALVTSNYPVLSVASVSVNGQAIPAATGENDLGYLFDEDGIYLRGYVFARGVQNVTVQYRAGYTTTPPVVDECCAMLVAKKYKYLDRIGHLSKSLAGEVVAYEKSDMTDEMKSMLRNFNKVVPN